MNAYDKSLHGVAARFKAKPLPLILALDVATRTGYAYGKVGETPVSGSIAFGNSTDNPNVVFAAALDWLSGFLEPEPRPDIVVLEALLPPDAMRGHTQKAVRDRLAGLHGIMRAVARLRCVGEIVECTVGDVREHFIGTRGEKRKVAKHQTMLMCQKLGWKCKDDNAADALAIWSYAGAIIAPETALRTVPLFNRALIL